MEDLPSKIHYVSVWTHGDRTQALQRKTGYCVDLIKIVQAQSVVRIIVQKISLNFDPKQRVSVEHAGMLVIFMRLLVGRNATGLSIDDGREPVFLFA